MKGRDYFCTGESKHEKFYDFMEKFYIKNGRFPTTSELYNTFLNFKSYEVRSKIKVFRKNNPKFK